MGAGVVGAAVLVTIGVLGVVGAAVLIKLPPPAVLVIVLSIPTLPLGAPRTLLFLPAFGLPVLLRLALLLWTVEASVQVALP